MTCEEDFVDIENNYFEKDKLIEDRVEEIIIQFGGNDSDNDIYESDDDLIDAYDRQIIDEALQRAAEPTDSTKSTEICTDPRELTSTIQGTHGPRTSDMNFTTYLHVIL